MDFYTTSQLASKAKVNIQTIYYYEKCDLIPAAQRSRNGHRRFLPETLLHILFVRGAQLLGFSLKEIIELKRCFFGKYWNCTKGIRKIRRKILEMSEMNRILVKHIQGLKNALAPCSKQCQHNHQKCHLLKTFIRFSRQSN